MSDKYSRRQIIALGGISSLSGCLDRVPGLGDDEPEEPEIHADMAVRAEEAEAEILEDELLLDYEEADERVIADSARVELTILRDVGIGDAQEYRVSAEADLGRNIDDLEGYVEEDRQTLIDKLSEPSYDMTTVVFEHLEEYDAEERNVHQTRLTQYQTRFHGRNENFVRYRISSEQLREFEEEEDYLEHFIDNAEVHIDGDTY